MDMQRTCLYSDHFAVASSLLLAVVQCISTTSFQPSRGNYREVFFQEQSNAELMQDFVFFMQDCMSIYSDDQVGNVNDTISVHRFVSSADVKNFFMPKVAPRTDSQSSLLTKKDVNHLYKIQFHHVKPGDLIDYKELCAEYIPRVSEDPTLPTELVGSWSCWYGEQDQVVHLWRYTDGFPSIGKTNTLLSKADWYQAIRSERSKMLLSRSNQLLYEFSFWNEVVPREGPNIYELRTYHLKPGTMIEWANNWARGIRARQESSEPVGGFFSEIGDLNVVHHLWAYKDLEHRKTTRQAAWTKSGWDNTVYYTVPLIREMKSSILIPLSYSPLK